MVNNAVRSSGETVAGHEKFSGGGCLILHKYRHAETGRSKVGALT